jgi:hypothetical protein
MHRVLVVSPRPGGHPAVIVLVLMAHEVGILAVAVVVSVRHVSRVVAHDRAPTQRATSRRASASLP